MARAERKAKINLFASFSLKVFAMPERIALSVISFRPLTTRKLFVSYSKRVLVISEISASTVTRLRPPLLLFPLLTLPLRQRRKQIRRQLKWLRKRNLLFRRGLSLNRLMVAMTFMARRTPKKKLEARREPRLVLALRVS